MDVSSPVGAVSESGNEICETCGYSRIGLPRGARCPECGKAPPADVTPVLQIVGAARNRSEQAWLVSVGVGLALLVFCSIVALKVTLVMPIGGLVLPSINAPAPKLYGAVLIQRSMGDPGPWGVLGTLAALGNVLAIWLITEPRARLAVQEDAFSARRLARWSAVVGFGGLFGVLMSGYGISRWWAWEALPVVAASIAIVEMPANLLLYRYLRQISARFDAHETIPRERVLLRISTWLIPVVCLSGAAMSLLRGQMQDNPVEMWRIVQSAYGIVALSAGMIMTAGTLHLAARVIAGALDRSLVSLAGKLARLRRSAGWLVSSIRSDPKRWTLVAGILLWLWNARPMLGLTAMIEHRRGLGGDLPALNFIGPKVWAVALLDGGGYYSYPNSRHVAVITTLFAIWMMTHFAAGSIARRWNWMARWIPTLLLGMALGLALTIRAGNAVSSRWAAAMMIGVEAPATLLVYFYLSKVAGALSLSRLATQLRCVALAATALIVSPIAFYVLSRPLRGYHNHPVAIGIGGIYGALIVAVGVLAWAVLVRLVWALIAQRRDSAHASTRGAISAT